MEFQALGRRVIQAAFDGRHISSDDGALLLRGTDERFGITERLASCFTDYRDPDLSEHTIPGLVRQRIFGLALGYEDLNDYDDLTRDSLLALALGNTDPEGDSRRREQDRGKVLASRSTLNHLGLTPPEATTKIRYMKIVYHPEPIQAALVDIFLD